MKFTEKEPSIKTARFVDSNEFSLKTPETLKPEFIEKVAQDYVSDCLKKAEDLTFERKDYFLHEAGRIKKLYLDKNNELKDETSEDEEYLYRDRDATFDIVDFMEYHSELDHERIYSKVYKKYKNAMERKKGRTALDYEFFTRHFFLDGSYDETKIFGSDEKGYLLGNNIEGTFLPTHFAPASLRAGASLINDLNINNISTCFFIPDDLRDTIIKLDGWKFINKPIPMNFRGEIVLKYPVFNKYRALLGIAIRNAKNEYYYKYASKFGLLKDYKNIVRRYIRKISRSYLENSYEQDPEVLTEIFNILDTKKGY